MLNSIIRLPVITDQFQKAVMRQGKAQDQTKLDKEASAHLRNQGLNELNSKEFFNGYVNHLEVVDTFNEGTRDQIIQKVRDKMNKEFEDVNPESLMQLSPRYAVTDPKKAQNQEVKVHDVVGDIKVTNYEQPAIFEHHQLLLSKEKDSLQTQSTISGSIGGFFSS